MKHEIDICEYMKNSSSEDILVDLRDKISFGHGSIPGAINIPLEDIIKLYQLPKEKKIFVFCQIGEFSKQATELLLDAGYDAYNLTDGYRKYLIELFSEA